MEKAILRIASSKIDSVLDLQVSSLRYPTSSVSGPAFSGEEAISTRLEIRQKEAFHIKASVRDIELSVQ